MSTNEAVVPTRPWQLWRSPYLWLATVHLVGDAVVVLTSGVLVLAAVAVVVLAWPLTFFGIPLSAAAARCVYTLAGWERARARITRGQQVRALTPPTDARDAARDPNLWRQFLYFALLLPVATAWGGLLVAAWSVPLVAIGLPLYFAKFAAGRAQFGPFVVDSVDRALFAAVLAAAFLLLVTPLLMRAASAADGWLVGRLLGRSETSALTERVSKLVASRQQVVDSVEAERRRMERDLHDGAQQRLVSLAMTLGRAKNRLGQDEQAVRALIEQAHAEALQAIAEIRDLTRGLHPPVLTDRGLDAALSAVAARSPVPVSVTVDVEPRPSLTVESIAYFVVTEALTNVAKHARAAQARVSVTRTGGILRIEVSDDGQGGAHLGGGTGLQGLSDRVAGVDGRLGLSSPVGGPTVLIAEVPCT